MIQESGKTATKMKRRSFIARSAMGFAGLAGAPNFISAQGSYNKLNIGVIGSGGRGAGNLAGVSSENIVALCDVNKANLDRAAEKHQNAAKYTDFRRLLDKQNSFDAVVVSTCEHTHAMATLAALQMKKHVYCEKPLTHNVHEARMVRQEAAKVKVATQMGIQIHSGENYRRVVELIQTNAIGPVNEVHVWVSRSWGLQSAEEAKKHGDIVHVTERPKDSTPVPAGLDWDLWLGPAPYRPFHEVYFPGPKWYRWWDFGNGTMSDLGSHWNDLPFWALKLQAPSTIEAFGPPANPEIAPATMRAVYEFPKRGDLPAVKMTWHQGTSKPDLWNEGKIPKWGNGVLFIGSKGMLLSDYSKYQLLPEKQFEGFKAPEPFIPRVKSHYAEWIEACKTGKQTSCNFEYSGWLTESNHLGNVAYRVGKKLLWDAANIKATNCPEADKFIRREYRKGWQLS